MATAISCAPVRRWKRLQISESPGSARCHPESGSCRTRDLAIALPACLHEGHAVHRNAAVGLKLIHTVVMGSLAVCAPRDYPVCSDANSGVPVTRVGT